MDDYYDQIAEGYEELHREEQEKKISFIKKRLDDFFIIKNHHSLLDVGCGTGITTIPWPCRRTGIDPARKLLEKANTRKVDSSAHRRTGFSLCDNENVLYVLGRAEEIPFEDNSFDIVTSITAIQNFEDIEKGLLEIRRVGKDFFILTYLKKSQKAIKIEEIINRLFDVKSRFEEEKDIIFFLNKK